MERLIVFRPGRPALHVMLVRIGGRRRRQMAQRMAAMGFCEPAIAAALRVKRDRVPGLLKGLDPGFELLRRAMRTASRETEATMAERAA